MPLRIGVLDGRPVIGTVVGVGPAAASRSVRRLLDATEVDHVVVIGVCGGIDPALGIGDLVVPTDVADETGHSLVPAPLVGLEPRGRLLTTSTLVMDAERHEAWRADGIVAVDMETAAVGAVCEARGVTWSVVRAVSDRPSDGLFDASIMELLRPDGSPDLRAVARRVVRHPRSIATLARLGRDSSRAAKASVAGAVDAVARS